MISEMPNHWKWCITGCLERVRVEGTARAGIAEKAPRGAFFCACLVDKMKLVTRLESMDTSSVYP